METAIDFRSLKYNQRFQEMCNLLVLAENPNAQVIDGKGGDMGIDSYLGTLDQLGTIFQYKYFLDRLNASKKRKIQESLRAASKLNPHSWILLVPIDFTLSEDEWFDRLKREYTSIELQYWGHSKLTEMLLKHPHVLEKYFPEKATEIKIAVVTSNGHPSGTILPKQELKSDVIPSWFRIQRTIMERIQEMFSKADPDDGHKNSGIRFDQFKLSLDRDLCENDLIMTPGICAESPSAGGVWNYVQNEILRGLGTDQEVLSFLLYEVRTALLLKSYHYVQEKRYDTDPKQWEELAYAFLERWNRIIGQVRYSGSIEERLPDEIFQGFVLKENLDPDYGEKYLKIAYEASKWYSLTRTSSVRAFQEVYQRALDIYEDEGRKLVNKANQHKKYRLGRHRWGHIR